MDSQILCSFDEPDHLLIDVISVSHGRFHSRSRLSAALRPLDSCAKTFVIRVEVEQEIVGIDLITGLVGPQNSLKKPGCMTDMPSRRTHELGGLNYIVFNLERRDDFHRAPANALIKLYEGLLTSVLFYC